MFSDKSFKDAPPSNTRRAVRFDLPSTTLTVDDDSESDEPCTDPTSTPPKSPDLQREQTRQFPSNGTFYDKISTSCHEKKDKKEEARADARSAQTFAPRAFSPHARPAHYQQQQRW